MSKFSDFLRRFKRYKQIGTTKYSVPLWWYKQNTALVYDEPTMIMMAKHDGVIEVGGASE